MKVGFKLWGSNIDLADECEKLVDQNIFDYGEIHAKKDTFDDCVDVWSSKNINYIIHAAHQSDGFNPANPDLLNQNIKIIDEAKHYADKLKSDIIICHLGYGGTIEEAIRQLKIYNDDRIIVENLPRRNSELGEYIGVTPDEIKLIMNEGSCGLCFDFAHALCGANSYNIDYKNWFEKFNDLNPRLYHISDGHSDGLSDPHYHLGIGDYDIKYQASFISKENRVSLETYDIGDKNMDLCVKDAKLLKNIKY